MSALKLKELTIVIAGSFCFWNVDIASANAASLTFTNHTNDEASDLHILYKLTPNDTKPLTLNLDAHTDPSGHSVSNSFENPLGFPIKPGKKTIPLPIPGIFDSAEWSFADKPNVPVSPDVSFNDSDHMPDFNDSTVTAEPVPEPTTTFGSAICLGIGGWLKRKKSSHQNKTTSSH